MCFLEFLFQVLDLLSLGLLGIFDFGVKELHDFSADGLTALCDGWPLVIGVGGFVKELTQGLEVHATAHDTFPECLEEGGHGGALNEHGIHVIALAEESEVVGGPLVM